MGLLDLLPWRAIFEAMQRAKQGQAQAFFAGPAFALKEPSGGLASLGQHCFGQESRGFPEAALSPFLWTKSPKQGFFPGRVLLISVRVRNKKNTLGSFAMPAPQIGKDPWRGTR
jgi:hypothetical protein